jgi:hypothetical protein
MNTNQIIAAVFLILVVLYMIGFFSKKESYEDTEVLDNIDVAQNCKDMTPTKLFNLFNEDLTYLTQVFVDQNIPQKAIQDATYYPKIATLLQQKKILKCV